MKKKVVNNQRRRVRFILAWQDYDLDDVVELPAEQAEILIRRAIAVEDHEEPVIVRP